MSRRFHVRHELCKHLFLPLFICGAHPGGMLEVQQTNGLVCRDSHARYTLFLRYHFSFPAVKSGSTYTVYTCTGELPRAAATVLFSSRARNRPGSLHLRGCLAGCMGSNRVISQLDPQSTSVESLQISSFRLRPTGQRSDIALDYRSESRNAVACYTLLAMYARYVARDSLTSRLHISLGFGSLAWHRKAPGRVQLRL